MKKTNTFFLLALTVIILGSCTVERRLHNKGFHVQWSKKYKADKSKENKNQELAVIELHEDSEIDQKIELKPIETSTAHADNKQIVTGFESAPATPDFEIDQADEVPIIQHSVASNSVQSNVSPTAVEETLNYSNKSAKKKSNSSSDGSSGKSQVIALLLVIFFGILGVHRFYLGYTGVGVLMILTLGVFGILTLIDFIRIIVGDLGPKNGEYGQRLEDL